MQIFISHSSKNAEEAARICRILEQNGTPCFIAPRDIRSGHPYAEELIDGIDHSAAIILLMSEEANHSPHVLREVERAVSKSIPILVYKLEEIVLSKSMEYYLMTHQWISAQSDENCVDVLRFVEDLKHGTAGSIPRSTDAPGPNTGQTNPVSPQNVTKDFSATDTIRKKRLSLAVTLLAVLCVILGGAFVLISHFQNQSVSPIAIGDTVTFGTYLGEPIEWRVLRLSEDNRQAVLISANILTMKAYDAAEGGKYNWYDGTDYWSRESAADTDFSLQILVRGNNIWSSSNIRTWLNSADEVVKYADQAPLSTAMAERKNGYQNEAGFLHGFTEEELAAIVAVDNTTQSNPLYDADTVTTTDRIYLLSLEELSWFDDAGISKFALPTQAAVEQDESGWYLLNYNDFHIEECSWWLREPVEGTSSKCYLVGNGYTDQLLRQENAGLEGFGIRPALTVDLRKADFR